MCRSLVNVNQVKAAINILRMCNWLYKDITEGTIDEATRRLIDVSNSATSGMFEKASKDDITSFQAYTIPNLDNKMSTHSERESTSRCSVSKKTPLTIGAS